MCGIVGYIGPRGAKSILLEGLERLEYRGYDSVGIALMSDCGDVDIVKTTEKVVALKRASEPMPDANRGIGHTRWATHGAVNETNAHPHRAGKVTLVHNGIIENYHRLRAQLAEQGMMPVSDTDTEIAAMLIDRYYSGEPGAAIIKAVSMIEGSYTFAIMFDDHPEKLYAISHNNPLAVMETDNGCFLASDVLAYLKYSRLYRVPGNDVLCELTADKIDFFKRGERIAIPEKRVDWDVDSADRMGYPHYMLKEIYEQPGVLRRTLSQYLTDTGVDFSADGLESGLFEDVSRVHIIACGTAMHAGLTVRPMFEKLSWVDVTVEVSSEFRDREARVDKNTLYILISQSGETADTLAALRMVKQGGARFISVINVKGSTMARESHNVVYTQAGPEIAVASTKAFTTQVAVLYLIAMKIAECHGRDISAEIIGLRCIDRHVEQMLERREEIRCVARKLVDVKHLFYLGRGVDMALAEEGALKIKEISYIHAEAYPAGEMKHGIISLIEPGVPTVVIATQRECYAKSLLCAQENLSRGGEIIMVVPENWDIEAEGLLDVIRIPGDGGLMSAFAVAVALQLLAYECAQMKGLPIDQPRNLAKSVTVA